MTSASKPMLSRFDSVIGVALEWCRATPFSILGMNHYGVRLFSMIRNPVWKPSMPLVNPSWLDNRLAVLVFLRTGMNHIFASLSLFPEFQVHAISCRGTNSCGVCDCCIRFSSSDVRQHIEYLRTTWVAAFCLAV